MTNAFEHTPKVTFQYHGHLEFVVIDSQKHLSKRLFKQNSLLFLNKRVHQLTKMTGTLSASYLLF